MTENYTSNYSLLVVHMLIISLTSKTNTTYCLPFILFTWATVTPFLPKNFFIFSSATSCGKPRTNNSLPEHKSAIHFMHRNWISQLLLHSVSVKPVHFRGCLFLGCFPQTFSDLFSSLTSPFHKPLETHPSLPMAG